MLYEHCLLVSFHGNPLCATALAHPVTSSQLYVHLLNKVLWCLICASRSVGCNITASLSYICTCRYLPLGVGCCCGASSCSFYGCVVGATDGGAVGAVDAFTAAVGTACLAAADGVLTGCSTTSTFGSMSGLTASG